MPTSLDAEILDFARAFGQLIRRTRGAAASLDVSLSESSVLSRLEKVGPATSAELAREEGMRPQSMGTTIASLEERGLVTRTPHPTDGRQMLVGLTGKGVEIRKRIMEAKLGWLRDRVHELPEKDRATLFAAGKVVKRVLEHESR